MRGVVREAAVLGHRIGQAGQQGVELGGQAGQLVAAAAGAQALAQRARRQPLNLAAQPLHRLPGAPGKEVGQQQHQYHAEQITNQQVIAQAQQAVVAVAVRRRHDYHKPLPCHWHTALPPGLPYD